MKTKPLFSRSQGGPGGLGFFTMRFPDGIKSRAPGAGAEGDGKRRRLQGPVSKAQKGFRKSGPRPNEALSLPEDLNLSINPSLLPATHPAPLRILETARRGDSFRFVPRLGQSGLLAGDSVCAPKACLSFVLLKKTLIPIMPIDDIWIVSYTRFVAEIHGLRIVS